MKQTEVRKRLGYPVWLVKAAGLVVLPAASFYKKDLTSEPKFSIIATMKKIHFYDIRWDTDGESVDETELPKSVTLEVDDDVDIDLEGADILSDEFGWCVLGFNFKEVPNLFS